MHKLSHHTLTLYEDGANSKKYDIILQLSFYTVKQYEDDAYIVFIPLQYFIINKISNDAFF
jgi:hypothetical protein